MADFNCEKRRFATRSDAKRFASRHMEVFGRQRPYPCDNCFGWHLTSKGIETVVWYRNQRAA